MLERLNIIMVREIYARQLWSIDDDEDRCGDAMGAQCKGGLSDISGREMRAERRSDGPASPTSTLHPLPTHCELGLVSFSVLTSDGGTKRD